MNSFSCRPTTAVSPTTTLLPNDAELRDLDPMASEMQQVDAVIRARLSSDVALIEQISHYIIGAGGKRIRPRR